MCYASWVDALCQNLGQIKNLKAKVVQIEDGYFDIHPRRESNAIPFQ